MLELEMLGGTVRMGVEISTPDQKDSQLQASICSKQACFQRTASNHIVWMVYQHIHPYQRLN